MPLHPQNALSFINFVLLEILTTYLSGRSAIPDSFFSKDFPSDASMTGIPSYISCSFFAISQYYDFPLHREVQKVIVFSLPLSLICKYSNFSATIRYPPLKIVKRKKNGNDVERNEYLCNLNCIARGIAWQITRK